MDMDYYNKEDAIVVLEYCKMWKYALQNIFFFSSIKTERHAEVGVIHQKL